MKERKIVYKIEEGINPEEVYCTTYQMRNFYAQFSDGFFSSLDVMNYIQHHAAVLAMKKDWVVLDVCCGRGMLLPLIRYYRPEIREYIGVDISQQNINEQLRRSGVKKIDDVDTYYPFTITHIISSVEDMDQVLQPNSIDYIVYTSAIEHMQKDVGYKSLENCYRLLKPGHRMFLSYPNTDDKKDPYDTQYAAHIYEWSRKELSQAVREIGFEIDQEYGLVAKVREFEEWMKKQPGDLQSQYWRLKEYLPSQWLMSFMPILHPEAAAEVLMIIEKPISKRLL
jgi:ubiquinone/menaquinone biosynthesis C-methylase UbiE